MEHNRAERRAIEQGRGRLEPFINVDDADSLFDYTLTLEGSRMVQIWNNEKRLFIASQADYSGLRDDEVFNGICY